MNLQQIFDNGVRGIRNQRALARNPRGGCRYRTDNGCKCALGHSIPNDKYDPSFEGLSPSVIGDNPWNHRLAEILGAENELDCKLLSDFQWCHDSSLNVAEFLEQAREFARLNNLNTDVLDAPSRLISTATKRPRSRSSL